MAGFRIHRNEARRYTAMAQIGAVVLLVGAVAAYAFLPVAGRVEAPAAAGEGPGGAEQDQSGPPIDFQRVAEGLSAWDGKKVEAEGPKADVPIVESANPVHENAGTEWKYLGAIAEPTRLVAIVGVDGSQRLMAPGSTFEGADKKKVRVLEVGAESMVVSDASGERTLELVKKEGAVLGTAAVTETSHTEGSEHEGELDPDTVDPRAMDRRGTAPKRTQASPPGARNIPRPPRPTTGGTDGTPRPVRPVRPAGAESQ